MHMLFKGNRMSPRNTFEMQERKRNGEGVTLTKEKN